MKTACLIAAAFVCLLVADCRLAIQVAEARRVFYFETLPLNGPPLRYSDEATDNSLVRLQKSIVEGTVVLSAQKGFGYLPDLLNTLEVPVDSQVLVRQSGSRNFAVTARRPRALYFRDDMVIAYVAGHPELEIAVHDALRGTLFYSLQQEGPFELRRRNDCLICHNNAPGNETGVPRHIAAFGDDLDGQPLRVRWHGRYVSGGGPNVVHFGNLMEVIRKGPELRRGPRPTLTDITDQFEASEYLSPHSDIVANLVLDHQVHVWNWIARLTTEHQLNLRSVKDKTDLFLACALLHADQGQFDEPISGTSDFTKWYVKQAPRDPKGRSLSELDLHHRLFRYGVSPMIYSRPFQQLPGDVKQRIYTLIDEMLAGTRPLPGPKRSDEDRALARSILRATVADYSVAHD